MSEGYFDAALKKYIKTSGNVNTTEFNKVKNTVETLTGDGEGSIDNKISNKIAEVVAGAPEKFDTLKEVADWIDSDTTGAAKMQNDISTLNTDMVSLKKSVSDGKTIVADAITTKGVTTATDATFAIMAENIGKIETDKGVIAISAIDFIGETITLSGAESNTVVVDNTGFCSFKVKTLGDYTISCGENSSADITVDSLGKVYFVLLEVNIPDGNTVASDNVSTWLRCAGINDKNYTNVSEVLDDNDTMFALTSDENAMKYLARSTSFADTLCSNETFMTYLGQSAYVDDTVLNSDFWVTAICDSAYFEAVLNVSVPTMTSNTTPSGEASASSMNFTTEYAYKAFDKFIDRTHGYGWANNSTDNKPWVQYDFGYKVIIKLLHLQSVVISSDNDNEMSDFYVSASIDGITFDKLTDTLTFAERLNVAYNKKFVINSQTAYRYWRIYPVSNVGGSSVIRVSEANFYGRIGS